MKVCTDSCLFGAVVADKIERGEFVPNHLLDIGGGTGLLSLMLVQKCEASVHAIEMDPLAFEEMKFNFGQSPWGDRLVAIHDDVENYKPANKYDFIISNPPFFENSLKSDHTQKNLAKHQKGLTLQMLLHCIKRLINTDGAFAVLLPFFRSEYFQKLAAKEGYYITEVYHIRQTSGHDYFRSILFFEQKEKGTPAVITLSVKDNNNAYTLPFKKLLEDYYLPGF